MNCVFALTKKTKTQTKKEKKKTQLQKHIFIASI